METEDVALLTVRVRPPHPGEQFGEGFLHDNIVEAQIARTLAVHPADQSEDQLLRRPGQNPKQAIQGIMGAARQHGRDAHGGLAFLQQDEPGDVEGHQLDHAAGPAAPYVQHRDHPVIS